MFQSLRSLLAAGLLAALLPTGPARADLPDISSDLARVFQASYTAEAQGKYDEAYKVVNDYVGQTRASYVAIMRLAYLKGLMGRSEEAAQLFGTAAELQPRAIEPIIYQQYHLLALKDWEKLTNAARGALRLDANHYVSRTRLAYALYNQARYLEAAEEYAKVANLYPLDLDVMLMRGWCYALAGKKAQAQMLFKGVLTLSPDNASAKEGVEYLAKLRE
jgi:tetratricopeptide (TPR) repeat protein